MKSLYHYFKRDSLLPSPTGPLSKEVPATTISAANKEVLECLKHSEDEKGAKKRGTYQKYSGDVKAKIGNYAAANGTSAAICYFKSDFPNLKYTSVCEWKNAVAALTRKSHEMVETLEEKKRGRPSLLPEDITSHLTKYIHAIRDAGGIINTAIVIAAGLGIVKNVNPGLLECNGGYVVLKKSWAKYLLSSLNFVKRKATTKKPKFTPSNFEELKSQYLMDIMAVVTMEDVPEEMIVNWDQTAIKYIPVSNWTMAKEGSKRVEVAGIDDKRQITATFAALLSGNFLPVQLVYEGKTTRCHPAIDFPDGFHITHTENHWCNEETMISYIEAVIVPYMVEKEKAIRTGLKA